MTKLWNTSATPPCFRRHGRTLASRSFLAYLFYLILEKSDVSVLCPKQRSFFASLVTALRDYYLHPHLFSRFYGTQTLNDLRQRIHFVFFFRVRIQLKIYIRAELVRVVARLVAPIRAKTFVHVRIVCKFRRVVLRFRKLNFRILRVHRRFHNLAPFPSAPDIEMYFTAERSHLKREPWTRLSLEHAIKERGLARVRP